MFCHECGANLGDILPKFCGECGVKQIDLNTETVSRVTGHDDEKNVTEKEASRLENHLLKSEARATKLTVTKPKFTKQLTEQEELEMLRENRKKMEEKARREGKIK